MLDIALKGLLLSTALLLAPPVPAQDLPLTLAAREVPLADGVGNGDRIGKLRILGLLELPAVTANGIRLAELSGLAWDDDDNVLYAVSDQGKLFAIRPVFGDGYLTGAILLKALPLREPKTNKPVRWRRTDAEGLDIFNGRNRRKGDAELLISFEREPRIHRYRTDGTFVRDHPLPAPLNDPHAYQGGNKGLESVCIDNEIGVLTAPEVPLEDTQPGYTRVFALSGRGWLYPSDGYGAIVAIECLGNGELLIMHRDFRLATLHARVTLRRVRIARDAPDPATLEARTVAVLDSKQGLQLDNFEGLARHRGNRYFMVSDNNDVFVQRTLLLYFELLD